MNPRVLEVSHASHFYSRWGNNRGGSEISYQDSNFLGYYPSGAFFTVILGTSVIDNTVAPIITVYMITA